MDSVRIGLAGFSADEVADLKRQLQAIADVHEDSTVTNLQAHGAHEVLEAALANTTLIAEIATRVGEVAVSVGTILTAIKHWRSSIKDCPGQEVNVSGPIARLRETDSAQTHAAGTVQ